MIANPSWIVAHAGVLYVPDHPPRPDVVTCRWCGRGNRPGAEFCGDCGRRLELSPDLGTACASFSTPNPVYRRFCDSCGTPLAGRQAVTRALNVLSRRAPSARWIRLLRLPGPGLEWDRPAPRWRWSWDGISAWAFRNWPEVAAVVLLTVAAGFMRIYRVAEVPGGLHGDEALTGLDALRVIGEGWIGPYVGSALGQTTGPLHFTALVFALSEPTTFTLRLSMALLGVATVPAAYLMLRIGFGRWVALFAAAALTFSYWHVFYSRSAFMLISMPLMAALAAAALLIALRSSTRRAWLIAGVLLGLGVYSYTGYAMFVAVAAVFLGLVLILRRDELRTYGTGAAILAIGLVVAALPLIDFALSNPDFFSKRYRAASVLRDPGLQAAHTVPEKIGYFADRARAAVVLPLRHPRVDLADGMGGRGAMDPVMGLLAYAGLVIAASRWRSPPHLLLALTFVMGLSVLFLGAENVGEFRRTLLIAPFAYGLAGVAVVAGGQWVAQSLGTAGKPIAYAGGAAILVVAATSNVWTYFGGIAQEEHMEWVYSADLVDALDSAHELGDPGVVYFYSARWSYDYETRRFLYPDTPGVDRSREFGEHSLDRLDEGPVTYVLFPPYAEETGTLRERYPGGETVERYGTDGDVRFSIYRLP